ncbi:MAG: hypothetical protein NTX61_05665 [Bacteroidetes bacterium]|nr:hypothetical protein [Bacteroidota bacterium]
MKTTTIILAAIFALQVNFLFAANDGVPLKSGAELNYNSSMILAPVTPKEATFEDLSFSYEFSVLAPVTPTEAFFEDAIEEVININLVPVTPFEADFNDEPAEFINAHSLAPVIPIAADFDELY